ncbi:MAG: Por secretion system C-terminal sorting protein [Mucilaginibacter sp.]|uniref:S8 family serine peptidase n=1 Tax=Mucilaginibacter sp. TaxID=1882438 RepID=UPI00260A96EA|nr:S8 family serine peptidase [Mucilaginibacter sp.]MDB5002287.1 Por secretion system C-terminal sorting protein [Mucilaginibacter sp.]
MNKFYRGALLCVLLMMAGHAFSQQVLVTEAKKKELNNIARVADSSYIKSHQKALLMAKSRGWVISRHTRNGGMFSLQSVNSLGFPKYLTTHNNTTAAATTGTNQVQPGGSTGLNLSGSSAFLNNKLAIWDGGWVYAAHQEFAGKTISFKDTAAVIDHATHVAGTMIAKGVYAPAKGMAYNASTLLSYDYNNDVAEMSRAAPGLLLSNHSYGDVAGWDYNNTQARWEWYGLPGDTVDYSFGFYDARTQSFDRVAYNAPYYLIVESSGNNRGYAGPAVGSTYYGYTSRTNGAIINKGPRPATISSNTGYDIIPTTSTAKNILTVGAVNPLPNGPSSGSDVTIAYFSSIGPTDDGRVKPDIVGDGVKITSTSSSNPTAYTSEDGTSFSAPNVTGSLLLLQEYYAQKNSGAFMRAATLKGLACHTAIDAGNAGPDYIFGWGLLSMPAATQVITDNNGKTLIKENTLAQGQTQTVTGVASGSGPLRATISWTDAPGIPTVEGAINSRSPKLINDLDIRVSDGTNTFLPWVLDVANPSTPATRGDNIVDNIEQVYIPNGTPGKSYTFTVTHKGTLSSGSQAYSLIITGIGGATYCASAPASNADSRINNVTISNINNTPAAGCTTYSDFTNQTTQLEQGKTYPLSITLGTCGSNFNKAAKVFIDWDNNGVFDATELVATTNVINGTGTYTANVIVPTTVIPGNYSLMRVVLTETSDAATIQSCGTYAKGETQDYRVLFVKTNTDAGITAIVNPAATGTCNGTTNITVTIKNFGAGPISNIPVTVSVKAPDNTVTNISETYQPTLKPLQEDNFTLSNTFNFVAGLTYTITASTGLANDPFSANNQISQTAVIFTPGAPTALSALYCTNSNQYLLSGTGDGTLFWYNNIADALPFAYGNAVTTASAPVNNTYYVGLNDFSANAGPATKNVFTGGGYNQFTPSINVYTAVPVVIQSARLYIGNPGVITFNVTNSNGQTVATTSINAAATRSNPQAGALADDPNDQGRVYNLNLTLPAAGKYTITPVYDANVTLYRNNNGVTAYPFKAGNIFSILGNDAAPTTGTDTTFYKGFYYYLYDINIKSAGCASTARLPVTLSKPGITQAGNLLNANTANSTFASAYQWYLDGQPISGAVNKAYTALQSGNYMVATTLSTGCLVQSDVFTYALLALHPDANTDIGLTTFPEPANKQLNVTFVVKTTDKLTLSLINSNGAIAYTKIQTAAAGNFSTVINVANLSPGIYVLKTMLGSKIYGKKVLIMR